MIWSDIKLRKCLFCFCSDHMLKLLKIPANAFFKEKKTTTIFSQINQLDLCTVYVENYFLLLNTLSSLILQIMFWFFTMRPLIEEIHTYIRIYTKSKLLFKSKLSIPLLLYYCTITIQYNYCTITIVLITIIILLL